MLATRVRSAEGRFASCDPDRSARPGSIADVEECLQTAIRNLGGALYCDLRYDRIFTGHNGAQSYYAARGFRGWLRV